jgi:hypothetical protein
MRKFAVPGPPENRLGDPAPCRGSQELKLSGIRHAVIGVGLGVMAVPCWPHRKETL